MEIWEEAKEALIKGHRVALLLVVHSEGSSPGRQGFKMLVSSSGDLFGSIGGGIMEHKLVELCRNKLKDAVFAVELKEQIHQTNIPRNKSGMICSGAQQVAFYELDLALIDQLGKNKSVLIANGQGMFVEHAGIDGQFEFVSGADWIYKEALGFCRELHVVGGGHVGLALSNFGKELGFKVIVYDDRPALNTMDGNESADLIQVSSYDRIGDYLTGGNRKYVVLMSFGYKTDKLVLSKLLDQEFAYLGMMGSKEKVKRLMQELEEEGYALDRLSKVYSPIGLPINSKTPQEIAVSILAQIIQEYRK